MKERDIRPEALLSRFLELAARDATRYFGDAARVDVPCVACGERRTENQFEKHGFAYARCVTGGTLFQTPRPVSGAFEAFYRQSESARST